MTRTAHTWDVLTVPITCRGGSGLSKATTYRPQQKSSTLRATRLPDRRSVETGKQGFPDLEPSPCKLATALPLTPCWPISLAKDCKSLIQAVVAPSRLPKTVVAVRQRRSHLAYEKPMSLKLRGRTSLRTSDSPHPSYRFRHLNRYGAGYPLW